MKPHWEETKPKGFIMNEQLVALTLGLLTLRSTGYRIGGLTFFKCHLVHLMLKRCSNVFLNQFFAILRFRAKVSTLSLHYKSGYDNFYS